ncbi:long-chain fatty acid--CoA ligase [Angustibacter sp. Root456]|uniref:AMP-dependent synthetase/ligase n=1 Tax=Angustibacter sp. Root456 TaxID=1736539 RepID=UPI0007002808|nr:AMP-dependent synthetase/ligase [Angustibacter sp. Root456]KQX64438.1 long-chain fatty acid--CoA ligase [Angustibacter sp. Root456]
MAEFSVPALVAEPTTGNTSSLVVKHAAQSPDRVLFSRRVQGRWQDVTAAEFATQVQQVALGLIAAGIQPGDRVALMSKTRYEWTLVDFAIWSAGAITVPIYETSSAEQVSWILSDSGAVACVVETASHAKTVGSVRQELPELSDVWQIDAGGLDDVIAAGADQDAHAVDERRAAARPDDIATLIYTSGTTGRPKGCELTHLNFMALCDNAVARLNQVVSAEGASTLLFLPLAHVFARFIQVLTVTAGARLGHTADIKSLLDDLAEFQPTFVLSVPRVFEKIYNSAEAKAEGEGKGRIFHAAADTAVAWSKAQQEGGGGLGLRLKHAVFDKLVYAKLRAAMGGHVQYAVSGGAPLGERLGHFFRGAGITVLEGYGLTETTAPTTVNTPDLIKIGTVGPPLPGNSVRIADDGEVLIKGPHVMKGYWNNEQATAEALAGGWFHSGDLGTLDSDGYLRITGRKKEILVTAGGKNVAPAVLEDRIRAHPLVSQCIVVGDQKPFIGALITLDAEMLPVWLSNNGLSAMDVDTAAGDAAVQAEVQRAVDDANRAVSKAESIRKFRILPVDFTEEGGYLTPSLKLKRSVVMKDFAGEVEELYR